MTESQMANWLEAEAAKHERAKAMSGPYEATHTGDEDAAKCRDIAAWIRGAKKSLVAMEYRVNAMQKVWRQWQQRTDEVRRLRVKIVNCEAARDALAKESEGRRIALMAKADEARSEWIRAENRQAERDDQRERAIAGWAEANRIHERLDTAHALLRQVLTDHDRHYGLGKATRADIEAHIGR